MSIDTTYLERCVSTLEKAYALLLDTNPANIDYDMYRSASIKEFEIILEQSGKLLRKVLKPYSIQQVQLINWFLKTFSAKPYCG